MTDTMVVTQPQPVIYVQGSDEWSSGLFDFCENVPECLFAYFCLPCFACKTSRDYGENLCLPLADWVSGMIPPATMSMRVSMRHRYGITVRPKFDFLFNVSIFHSLSLQPLCCTNTFERSLFQLFKSCFYLC
uniref:PLAC8 like 1 n=1 Tax=Astatotilapia calliptera TaxID=8154 RepID=A0AAX7UBP3_ASTCA